MSNLIVNKQDGISTLTASEYNQFAEINNLISSAGITADANVLNQVAKSVANYSNASNFFTENGTVNNYTLIASGSFLAPTSYINGMVIRFITTNANTTTTPNVNLAGLGAKNILKADGNPLVAGDISGYVELRYNGTNFLLSPLSSALNITATNKGLTYLNNPITIANNATDADNDIDFTAGNFAFSDKSNIAVLLAMTKRLDASWTVGTNQGGLDTGSKANSTWYHCFAIYNPTSGVSDAIFSTNATTPSLPAGYTKYKRVGSIKTNASGNILPFTQNGKDFILAASIKDIDGAGTTSATLNPLTAPLGVKVFVIFDLYALSNSPPYYGLLTSPSQTDTIPSSNNQNAYVQGSINIQTQKRFSILTNESSQIRSRWTGSTDIEQKIFTYGWIDYQL